MNDEDQPIQHLPPSAKPKRFFDIVPPSKTKPSPTSRPIIDDGKPQQPDPMVMVDNPKVVPPTNSPAGDEGFQDSTLDDDMSSDQPSLADDAQTFTPTDSPDDWPFESKPSFTQQTTASQIIKPDNTEDSPVGSAPIVTSPEPEPEESDEQTSSAQPPESNPESSPPTNDPTQSNPKPAFDLSGVRDDELLLPEHAAPEELLLPAHASPDDPNGIIVHEHAAPKRKSPWLRFFQILAILILVAIVALDLLIDGGVISNPANLPVTHLFHN